MSEIFNIRIMQDEASQNEAAASGVFFSVPLEVTDAPVWAEDEEREEQSLRAQGVPARALAEPARAEEMLEDVTISLPNCLAWCQVDSKTNLAFHNDGFSYYAFAVPTSFIARENLAPRRLQLRLALSGTGYTTEVAPLVYALRPVADIHEEAVLAGEIKVDLWQAIRAVWPAVPSVVTASAGRSFDVKRVRPRIQASGLMTSTCEWRIADATLNYNFNALIVTQVPDGCRLAVSAKLAIDVEKYFLGVLHKAYGRSVTSRIYLPGSASGPLVARHMARSERPVMPVEPSLESAREYVRLCREYIQQKDLAREEVDETVTEEATGKVGANLNVEAGAVVTNDSVRKLDDATLNAIQDLPQQGRVQLDSQREREIEEGEVKDRKELTKLRRRVTILLIFIAVVMLAFTISAFLS